MEPLPFPSAMTGSQVHQVTTPRLPRMTKVVLEKVSGLDTTQVKYRYCVQIPCEVGKRWASSGDVFQQRCHGVVVMVTKGHVQFSLE